MIKRSLNNPQVKYGLGVRCFELEKSEDGARRLCLALSAHHSKLALGLLGGNTDELLTEELRPVIVATLDVDGTPVYSRVAAHIEFILSGVRRDLAALLSVADPSDTDTTHFVLLHLDGEPEAWRLDGDFFSEQPGDAPAANASFYGWTNLEVPFLDAFAADKIQAFSAF